MHISCSNQMLEFYLKRLCLKFVLVGSVVKWIVSKKIMASENIRDSSVVKHLQGKWKATGSHSLQVVFTDH